MLARISGMLESIAQNTALVALESGLGYEVLLPAYLAERLAGRAEGGRVTFHTLEYLESLNQGASFVPRLIGFADAREREFFELLTSVKGLGNKRALRAMAIEPAAIARAIHDRDARALQRLPEIGPKLAELIVHELKGKVEAFARARTVNTPAAEPEPPAVEAKPRGKPRVRLGDAPGAKATTAATSPAPSSAAPPIRETVELLIALGEPPIDAERMVARAVDRLMAAAEAVPATAQGLLTAAYSSR